MIRLILGIILLAFSLLVLFKAPTNFFWKMAVAVTEFPYIPATLSLILLISSFRTDHWKWLNVALAGVSFIIFLLPFFRIYSATSDLENRLQIAFGKGNPENPLAKPFSLSVLFGGTGTETIHPETFVYQHEKDRDLAFDFYRAQTGKNRPLIIVIHGGSWSAGEKEQLPALNGYLAQRGYNVAAMTYHFAPAYHYPAPVKDVQHVIDFIRSHKDLSANTNTGEIILIGRSAGGQIALQSAYVHPDKAVKGVVAYYPPADMFWGAHIKTNKLVLDADKVMSDYIGGSVQKVPEKYKLASAPEFVSEKTVPTLLLHGPNDPMVAFQHSVRLDKKLEENHVPHLLVSLPCASHGFDYNFCGPDGQASTFAVERFIAAILH